MRLAGEGRPQRVPLRRSGWGWSMCPGKGSPCSKWLQAAVPTGNSSGAIFLLEINHTPIGQAADVARIVSSAPCRASFALQSATGQPRALRRDRSALTARELELARGEGEQ